MKMRAQDGHLFAEVTLRDVLERTDVSDMPMLSEIKRLYDENDKLRELVDAWMGCGTRYHTMQGGCPMFDADAEDFCKAPSIAHELGIEVE